MALEVCDTFEKKSSSPVGLLASRAASFFTDYLLDTLRDGRLEERSSKTTRSTLGPRLTAARNASIALQVESTTNRVWLTGPFLFDRILNRKGGWLSW